MRKMYDVPQLRMTAVVVDTFWNKTYRFYPRLFSSKYILIIIYFIFNCISYILFYIFLLNFCYVKLQIMHF